MSESHLQHRTGVALVIAAAVAWSTAAFFTRLLHFDSWTILFWRGLFGGGFIALPQKGRCVGDRRPGRHRQDPLPYAVGIHHRDRAFARSFGRLMIGHLARQRVEADGINVNLGEEMVMRIDFA